MSGELRDIWVYLAASPLLGLTLTLTAYLGATTLYRELPRLRRMAGPLTLALAAHGIGTARAFQSSETAGAFAGLAMGLNGLLTALWVPVARPAPGRR